MWKYFSSLDHNKHQAKKKKQNSNLGENDPTKYVDRQHFTCFFSQLEWPRKMMAKQHQSRDSISRIFQVSSWNWNLEGLNKISCWSLQLLHTEVPLLCSPSVQVSQSKSNSTWPEPSSLLFSPGSMSLLFLVFS